MRASLKQKGGQRCRGRRHSETATCRCNVSDRVAVTDLLSPRSLSLARLLSRARLSFAHALLTHSPSHLSCWHQFITQYLWDTRVPTELRTACGGRRPARDQPACRKVRVTPIAEGEAHPAAGQFGLFAAQTLAPGEHVLDYLGLVCTEETCNPDSQYVAALAPGLLCDAEKFGNEARFTNDFHGTGKNPNVRFERRVDKETGEHRLGIHVLKRKIRKGEELLIAYGHSYSFS